MENFEFEILSVNEFGQCLVEFVPDDSSLRTIIINVKAPNDLLVDVDPTALKAYCAQFSPQNIWEREKGFDADPVASVQHVGETGDETDVPVTPAPSADLTLVNNAAKDVIADITVDTHDYLGDPRFIKWLQDIHANFADFETAGDVNLVKADGTLVLRDQTELKAIIDDWLARYRVEELALRGALTDKTEMANFYNRL